MEKKPTQHWRRLLQFRISTWFLLVAVVAWIMTTDFDFFSTEPLQYSEIGTGFEASWKTYQSFGPNYPQTVDRISMHAWVCPISDGPRHYFEWRMQPYQLIWPLLIIGTFVGWRVAAYYREKNRDSISESTHTSDAS